MPEPSGTDPLPPSTAMIAKSGAAMYAGAAAVGAIESIVAGKATSSPVPILISFVFAALLWNFGGLLDRRVLMLAFGPIGVVLIAIAVATSPPGNGAVMYAWSVLCVAGFFGRRERVAVVRTVAAAQTAVVLYQPHATFDHWCDPVASMAVIAIVVRGLAARNARLVARLTRESRIDPLTGLLNRRGLEERFAVELARSKRDHRPLSVVAADIDHF